MTIKIPLHNQQRQVVAYALIDDLDAVLKERPWFRDTKGYVMHHSEEWGTVRLHRVVMGLTVRDGKEVDHRNRNKLDNRRSNLRLATRKENLQNHPPRAGGTSKFRGVDWHIQRGKWRARVHIDGKTYNLGLYENEDEAARMAKKFRLDSMSGALD